MRARKCDRCGAFYEHYEGKNKKQYGEANGLILVDIDMDDSYFKRKSYGLCPVCQMLFIAILKNTEDIEKKEATGGFNEEVITKLL